MYSIPLNEIEAEVLVEQLKNIDGNDLKPNDCNILRKIFDTTEYPGLRNLIAIKLVDAKDEELYYYLIKKLKQNIHTNTISPLVYCCTYYDCSDDIQLFIDLILLKSDMSLADAMGVINNMYEIVEPERIYALNKLQAYLKLLEPTSSKFEDVSIVINFLKNFKRE